MDFGLSEEHQLIRASVREFLAGECSRETARELDAAEIFPRDLLDMLANLGFGALCVPEEFGGAGRSLLGAAIVVEETAASSPALAAGFASVALRGGEVITQLGSRQQKERLLPEIARGALLFTFALRAGEIFADQAQTSPTATRAGDSFLLSGSEPLVSLGGQADFILTLARIANQSTPTSDSSLFLIRADASGLRHDSAAIVGCRGSGLGRVSFDGVRLTEEDLLGGPEQAHDGSRQARLLRAVDRLAVAAGGIGIAQGALEYAADYARQRVQFDRPIAEFEAIQQKFAKAALSVRAARLLLYEACWRAERQQSFELEAAAAAAQATSVARRTCLEAVQILGGQGYMLESDAQRYLRDSLVLFSGAERVGQLACEIGALMGIGREPEWTRTAVEPSERG